MLALFIIGLAGLIFWEMRQSNVRPLGERNFSADGSAIRAGRDRATGGQRDQRMDGGYGGISRPLSDQDGDVGDHREWDPAQGHRRGDGRNARNRLLAALEREGFVKSYVDRDDRRKLIARLTSRGEGLINKAFEVNLARFRAVFASLSPA